MKVLVTPRSFGKTDPTLFDRLRAAGVEYSRNDTGGILDAAAMKARLADCEGLIVGVDPVSAEVLEAAPKLRAVAKYGVGLDNIDLAACEARGIRVSRTLGAPTEAVADYTLALMLAVARKVPLIDARCRHKDWSKITGTDLFGATLGIIGLGSIGKAVVRRARGFSMKVLAHDLCWDDAYAAENGIERADVERICREADFISLHTVLDDSTRHMINAERLAMMKPTAILINTARGGLIDGAALLAAKRRLDPLQFEAMYQGRPSSREGLLYGLNFAEYDDLPREIVRRANYTDTADTGDDYLCSICYAVDADGVIYVTDAVYSREPMETTEPLVGEALVRSDTRQAAVESNNGGRGFARAVQALAPGVRVEWFHQSANKEARILSNSATVLHLLRWPRGWNLRWPELYAHLTTYRRKFRANRWHDAADVVTGIVEREAADRSRSRVRGVRFL